MGQEHISQVAEHSQADSPSIKEHLWPEASMRWVPAERLLSTAAQLPEVLREISQVNTPAA
jgi:hypothetical protein